MRQLRLWGLLGLFATLPGCALFTEVVEKPVYITQYRTIDPQYLTMCPITPPPNPGAYKAATDRGRIDLWIDMYSEHVEHTRMRNVVMEELIEINEHLSEAYHEDRSALEED